MEVNSVSCMESKRFFNDLHPIKADLIYVDPPFNTGKKRVCRGIEYEDSFSDDEYQEFLDELIYNIHGALTPGGSLFFHIDYRESHYCKILLDEMFGRNCFMNEIIWVYDYGARSKTKYSAKHDTIFWYVKDTECFGEKPKCYTFNYEELDRIPYMAPGLVGKEKAARGKTITDVWWHTIVPTKGKERVGYPTQKPLGILERIVKVHSNEGDLLLDPMCGSGSFGVAAKRLGRSYLLNDSNPKAVEVTKMRLERCF